MWFSLNASTSSYSSHSELVNNMNQNLTPEQLVEYWRGRAEELENELALARVTIQGLEERLTNETAAREEDRVAHQKAMENMNELITLERKAWAEERKAHQKAIRDLNARFDEERETHRKAIKELNDRLEEEKEAHRKSIKDLNDKLEKEREDRAEEREDYEKAIKDLNDKLEEEREDRAEERKANQKAIEDLNTRLNREIALREKAQEDQTRYNSRRDFRLNQLWNQLMTEIDLLRQEATQHPNGQRIVPVLRNVEAQLVT